MSELLWVLGGIFVAWLFCLWLADRRINPEKIRHVELLGKRNYYKTGYEQEGFSWGNDGFRTYYGKKSRYSHTEVFFRVTFTNGKSYKMGVPIESPRCKGLIEFMEKQERSK